MSIEYWPQNGPPAFAAEIPPFAYIEWYIPRLMEQRPHDLSQSGLQLDWASNLSDVKKLTTDPIEDGIDVRDLIAEREGVDAARVVPTHGATEAIHLALAAAMPAGSKRLAVEMPCYAPVCQSARMMGLETVEFQRLIDGTGAWRLDRDGLNELIPEVDGVIVTPVLNPTGFNMTKNDTEWLVESTSMQGIPLIADEVYGDSMRGTDSYRPFHSLGSHCVSINSLTKIYGLGMIRFGWFIASEQVAANGRRAFHTFNCVMAAPSVRLAVAAWPHLDRALAAIEERRKYNLPLLEEVLEKHGIDWQAPPFGLFGAFPIGQDAMQVIEGVAEEEGLLAIPGCMFHQDLKNWLRVAWSKPAEIFSNDVKALDRVLTRLQTQRRSG